MTALVQEAGAAKTDRLIFVVNDGAMLHNVTCGIDPLQATGRSTPGRDSIPIRQTKPPNGGAHNGAY